MSEGLQPKPVPKPAAGQTIPDSIKPGQGKPPMRSGQVYMTDQTRKSLEAVGWKEGDPVPGDLGVRLKQLQAEVLAESGVEGTEVANNWKPVASDFVKIEDLPPDKQAQVGEYLREFKEQMAEQQQIDAANARIESQIPQNIQGEQRELMRRQMIESEQARRVAEASRTQQASVVDDRVPPPSLAEKMETAAQQEQARRTAPTPPPETEPVPVATNSVPTQTHCQRCTWPLNMEFNVEATAEDKQVFLAGVLGVKSFQKKYQLLGGNLVVVFRSLTSQEAELLQTQLGHMARTGRIVGDAEYWMHLMELRLVIATSKIMVGGSIIYEAQPADTFKAKIPEAGDDTPVEPTGLLVMRDEFYAKGAKQEPVRRIIGNTHQQFQRLVEYLEAMTANADFWEGIELPG